MKSYIKYINWLLLILIISTIILLWLNAIHIANWINGTTYLNHYKDLSQIGDIFGVVTSLFSALSILGIIVTIYLQKQDLKLQRLELEATRNEFTIKRITEVIYHQIEIIDKTFIKSPFYYVKITWQQVQNPIFGKVKNERTQSNNGIDGIYKFNDGFRNDINLILSQEGSYVIKNIEVKCVVSNYPTLIYLGNSIIKSIEIIEGLIKNMPKSNEKDNLLSIFKASIGEEIFTFFKINSIFSNYYIMNKDNITFQNQEYTKTIKNIVDYSKKLSDSFIKVEINFRDIINQKII